MKITIIANMHHVDTALKYSDKIIGVSNGEIVFFDDASKVTKEVLDRIYQGENGSIE